MRVGGLALLRRVALDSDPVVPFVVLQNRYHGQRFALDTWYSFQTIPQTAVIIEGPGLVVAVQGRFDGERHEPPHLEAWIGVLQVAQALQE